MRTLHTKILHLKILQNVLVRNIVHLERLKANFDGKVIFRFLDRLRRNA